MIFNDCERDPRHVAEIVHGVGGVIVATQPHGPRGGPAHRVRLPSHAAKVALLRELGQYDGSYFPDVALLARQIAGRARSDAERAALIQRWMHANVAHIGEGIETFPTAPQVAMDGCGDCDDHVILAGALCSALAIPWRPATYNSPPTHVALQIQPHPPPTTGRDQSPAWVWVETTIPGAYFGEHPICAKLRLDRDRQDI